MATSSSCPCRDAFGQCESPAVCSGQQPALSFPGQGLVQGAVTGAKAVSRLSAWIAKLSAQDVIAILLGFAFFIVGLYLFRPVQQTIVKGAKVATRLAA